MTWQPTSIIRAPWGRFQVIVDGQDVSFFRGIPTIIDSFASSEPFGDDTAAISFQQITPFEVLGQGDLSWFYPWAPVEIYCVKPDGSRLPVLFEGEFPSLEDTFDESWATAINCLGVLHLLRNFRDRPNFKIEEKDIGLQIADAINTRIDGYGLRLQYAARNLTGISQLVTGTWTNDIETGTFQTLLSKATVSILPTRGAVTVDIAARPNGLGYWLLSNDGTVVPYGPGTPYYGSMINVPENGVPVAIESTPTGLGYWLVASDGGIFAFGDAQFFGSHGGSPLNQPVVDMKRTASGLGYWLLGGDGGVFNYGDAPYWGSLPGDGFSFADVVAIMPTLVGDGYSILRANGAMYNYGSVPVRPPVAITYSGQRFVDLELRPAGTGYWVLDALGNVYSFEGAPYEGGAGGLTLAAPMRRMAPRAAGYWLQAEDGGIFSYGDLSFWGSTPGAMGNFNQWTLMNEPGRRPVVRLKDLWTPHWSMRVGTPGLRAQLSTDYTQAVDVAYGEGVDPDGCWWRNTKYPGQRHGDPPLWFREIKLGTAGSDVSQWEQEMADKGWGVAVDGVYGTDDRDVCYALQTQAGLALTGTVTAQTWAVTFDIGNIGADPYFMPLAQDAELEPYLYNANGEPISPNPNYDYRKTRIESFESYGANTTKTEGIQAARSTINRFNRHLPDGRLVADPGVTGTLTLTSDPAEGSRFEIRAGHNFLLQSYRGQDVLLHIAHADHKPPGLTTDLTVDQKAHDLMTLGAIMERDKIATDLAKRPYLQPITSAMSPDGPVWDCENNAGVIPRHAIQSRLWNVLRIPAGQRGTIAQAEFYLDLHVEFSVALFAAPVTHARLANAMPNGPLSPMADGKNPWNELPADLAAVYVDAWGSPDQPAGYFPGIKSDGDPVTGVMKDYGAINYESQDVPWLYLAIWSATTTYVRGQLHPGFGTI